MSIKAQKQKLMKETLRLSDLKDDLEERNWQNNKKKIAKIENQISFNQQQLLYLDEKEREELRESKKPKSIGARGNIYG